jgi:PDZ domain-containing protein
MPIGRALWVALCAPLVAGCLDSGAGQETAAGSEGVEAYSLEPDPHTIGWPTSQWWVSGSVQQVSDSSSGLIVRGQRFAIAPSAGATVTLRAEQSWLFDPIQSARRTELGLILFHRPYKSRNDWRPFDCSLPMRSTWDPIGRFPAAVVVSLASGTVSAADGSSVTLSDCGVAETMPELAVMPFARSNLGKITGGYDYGLRATCDDYFCPSFDTARASEELGNPGEPWAGWMLAPLASDAGRAIGLEPGEGGRVVEVFPGSPAARAGIGPGDVITAIDDRTVTFRSIGDLVRSWPVGTPLALSVRRRGYSLLLAFDLEVCPDLR